MIKFLEAVELVTKLFMVLGIMIAVFILPFLAVLALLKYVFG